MSYKSRSLEALQVPRGSMIYLGNTNQDFICPDISNAGMIYLIYRRCRLFEARSLGTITSRVHSQSRNRYKVPGRTSKCIQYVLRLETLVSSMHYCFSVVFNGSFWCCWSDDTRCMSWTLRIICTDVSSAVFVPTQAQLFSVRAQMYAVSARSDGVTVTTRFHTSHRSWSRSSHLDPLDRNLPLWDRCCAGYVYVQQYRSYEGSTWY